MALEQLPDFEVALGFKKVGDPCSKQYLLVVYSIVANAMANTLSITSLMSLFSKSES